MPAAREVANSLTTAERDLAEVAERIRSARATDEPDLLRQLTQLAANVEGLYARTHARFSASAAYFELVQRRIDELREHRVGNLQTLREFIERRLLPAMQTCAWAARRKAVHGRTKSPGEPRLRMLGSNPDRPRSLKDKSGLERYLPFSNFIVFNAPSNRHYFEPAEFTKSLGGPIQRVCHCRVYAVRRRADKFNLLVDLRG